MRRHATASAAHRLFSAACGVPRTSTGFSPVVSSACVVAVRFASVSRTDVRNIAVIAHVDHGKTTLVDAMLKQSGTLTNAKGRVMDSKDQEKERGITILAKNTAIVLADNRRINIVDTPGHLDFSGEVERALQMVEGFILLVDAYEGVRPGTRYVLRKALSLNLKPIVCLNKVDKDDTNVTKTEQQIQDLFLETATSDDQLDIFFMYGSGRSGYMNPTLKKEGTLTPLFDSVYAQVPPPTSDDVAGFQMLVAQIDIPLDGGKLKTAVGRIFKGTVKVGQFIAVALQDKSVNGMVRKICLYRGLDLLEVNQASYGDICSILVQEPDYLTLPLQIGSTLCDEGKLDLWPFKAPDEPTYTLVMQESQASWKGKEVAKDFLGSLDSLSKRLRREAMVNTALRLEIGTKQIIMSGRGPLHLSVIIEDMRREGHEFEIQAPKIMRKEVDGVQCEPFEKVMFEFKDKLTQEVVSLICSKKGEMGDLVNLADNRVQIDAVIPVRLMSNLPIRFHVLTGGDGILNHSFDSYRPISNEETDRETGALICVDTGEATEYSMSQHHEAGRFFVLVGDPLYYGQIVGENMRTMWQHSPINITKRNEQLGGMRANANDKANSKRGAFKADAFTFEDCISWVVDDELVTVTPKSIRMRLPNFTGRTTNRLNPKK